MVSPGEHYDEQSPDWQVSTAAQALPHAPQLSGSFSRSAPGQSAFSDGVPGPHAASATTATTGASQRKAETMA